MEANSLVPKLRFREFKDTWESIKLGNFITGLKSGISVNSENIHCEENEFGILKTSSINEGAFIPNQNKRIIQSDIHRAKLNPKKNSIIISRMNTPELVGQIGYVSQNHSNLFIPDRLWQTVTNNKVNVKWLSYLLITPKIKYIIKSKATGTSGSMKNIAKPNFLSIPFNSPLLPEQNKIASFLTSVDKKINLLTKKKALLETYKKGVMQKIFSQEIRFKDEDGKDFPDWTKIQLSDIAERIKRKNERNNENVLTISAQLGLISQLQYFNKSVASKNLSNYTFLERDDFAYNKSYSKDYPMGTIKRLKKYDNGIVSSLYICFKLKNKASVSFIEQYFNYGLQNNEIKKVAQEGARNHGLLNIGINEFFQIYLKTPSLKEQNKIASFLSSIDKKIELVDFQLERNKEFKKGLLQQMFV